MSKVNARYLHPSGKKRMTILKIAMPKMVGQHQRNTKRNQKIIRRTKRHDT